MSMVIRHIYQKYGVNDNRLDDLWDLRCPRFPIRINVPVPPVPAAPIQVPPAPIAPIQAAAAVQYHAPQDVPCCSKTHDKKATAEKSPTKHMPYHVLRDAFGRFIKRNNDNDVKKKGIVAKK